MSDLFCAIFTNLPFYFVPLSLRQCRMEVVRKSLDSCHKFVRPASRKLSGRCQEVVRQLSQSCQAFITKLIRQLSGKYQTFVEKSSGCHQGVDFLVSCQEVVRKFSKSHQTVCHEVVRSSSRKLSGSCHEVEDSYQKVVRPLSRIHQAVNKKLSGNCQVFVAKQK